MVCSVSHMWVVPREAPAWIHSVLTAEVDPWSGAYCVVYPLNERQVVKLVSEKGALDFLRFCAQQKETGHFPKVHEILDVQVYDRSTGRLFTPVRMERLRNPGTVIERWSDLFSGYVRRFQGQGITDLVHLSAEALRAMSEDLKSSEPGLSEALRDLARMSEQQGWVADLANPENWMVREDILVISDPAHLNKNFSESLC